MTVPRYFIGAALLLVPVELYPNLAYETRKRDSRNKFLKFCNPFQVLKPEASNDVIIYGGAGGVDAPVTADGNYTPADH